MYYDIARGTGAALLRPMSARHNPHCNPLCSVFPALP